MSLAYGPFSEPLHSSALDDFRHPLLKHFKRNFVDPRVRFCADKVSVAQEPCFSSHVLYSADRLFISFSRVLFSQRSSIGPPSVSADCIPPFMLALHAASCSSVFFLASSFSSRFLLASPFSTRFLLASSFSAHVQVVVYFLRRHFPLLTSWSELRSSCVNFSCVCS